MTRLRKDPRVWGTGSGSGSGTERGIVRVDTPEGLSAIRRPDCAAVIWQRSPLPRFQTWIDGLAREQLPRTRVILRSELVRDTITTVAQTCGTPECAEREMLVEDVSALAAVFANVANARYLRLRLDIVTTDACRKFHVDAVRARLVCTYRGTGTQYGHLSGGGEPQGVFSVPTGAPTVMRGTLWPEIPASGLLHRSPPIGGTGETRLLLVLDPIDDPEEEPEDHVVH
ncbi:DUF1826 domain-containing protein [Rhodovulum sp. BSW8]|uniref:DUF1826 domain-containing protein n=1 Tax=Rhodovulum sp. BSW8 TaxID=2259645 RepID=UPI00352B468B